MKTQSSKADKSADVTETAADTVTKNAPNYVNLFKACTLNTLSLIKIC